ncbi:MAG: DegT/DnrJ/EryC1/StrS aminotransferase family protein [Calditrichia bacterium]
MKGVREEFLPFALPYIGEDEIAEVVQSLKSGWVTTGPKVKQFEEDFSEYVKSKNAMAVNSCTAGLHTALRALDIGPGDEVIVPALTFCATANVVVHLGARPVIVDVDEDFNVSAEIIEKAITAKTKAVMPVHHSGQSCDLEEIYEVIKQKRLSIVEDAAHAVGTVYHGKRIGADDLFSADQNQSVKRATVFSFYATKNMTTGEGGMVTTADDELAARIRLLSLHGMSKDAWKRYSSAGSWYYEVLEAGFKYNMTDIQAALGIHQLKRLNGFIETRQKFAAMYDERLGRLPEIILPLRREDRNHVYHLYIIRLDLQRLKIDRGAFIEKLKEFNVGSSVHFIPLHLHPFYASTYGYREGDLPVSESLYHQMISLPLYPGMSEQDVEYVCDVIHHLVEIYRR